MRDRVWAVPLALVVAFFVALTVATWADNRACERSRCERGAPVLIDSRCLCVELAQP